MTNTLQEKKYRGQRGQQKKSWTTTIIKCSACGKDLERVNVYARAACFDCKKIRMKEYNERRKVAK